MIVLSEESVAEHPIWLSLSYTLLYCKRVRYTLVSTHHHEYLPHNEVITFAMMHKKARDSFLSRVCEYEGILFSQSRKSGGTGCQTEIRFRWNDPFGCRTCLCSAWHPAIGNVRLGYGQPEFYHRHYRDHPSGGHLTGLAFRRHRRPLFSGVLLLDPIPRTGWQRSALIHTPVPQSYL